jgi:membrane-associated protease RseP (regulator of RpoE activity)
MDEPAASEQTPLAPQDLPTFITDYLWVESCGRLGSGLWVEGLPREAGSLRMLGQMAEVHHYAVAIERAGSRVRLTLHFLPEHKKERDRYAVNLILFIATFISVAFAGAIAVGYDPLADPLALVQGLPFAAALLGILTIHEMAHYIASRRHGVRTSLPYFIPMPLQAFGTFGAVIRVRSRIPDRQALLDLGASGPIAGFVVATLVYVLGLALPGTAPSSGQGFILFGNSLLTAAMQSLTHAAGNAANPVALAGWIGLWITAINLTPIGQLDGGHIAYALWGRAAGLFARTFFVLMLLLTWFWPGYIVWALIILFVMKLDHPAPADDYTHLSPARALVGYLAFLILILTFIPVPVSLEGI